MRKNDLFTCLMIITLTASLAACAQKKKFTSPEGYNLEQPEKFLMPESLIEISGITFRQGDPDSMYAIQDEEGKLFYFKPGSKTFNHAKYAEHGDYEDVTISTNYVVILRSDGTLYTFPFPEARWVKPVNIQKWKHLLPPAEYEGLYADNRNGKIYVLGKHFPLEEEKKRIRGFILECSGSGFLTKTGEFSTDLTKFPAIKKLTDRPIHPSALAKNELTGEWYILSSVNKLLIVTDLNWKVKVVHPLNPTVFHQPEGIIFDRYNNLYISNEGDKSSAGNVLRFVYNKQ